MPYPDADKDRVRRAMESQLVHYSDPQPLPLDSGQRLSGIKIAFSTYGTLNAEKSNAVLICHALTGDQFVTGHNPLTGKHGWWSEMVGAGRTIDTNRYFVICSNVLGGCSGSTGPGSINPATGMVYGIEFPHLTIADMVRAQFRLVRSFGIHRLFSVVGGSAGGMQALQWAADYGNYIRSAIAIATTAQESARNIALHEVSRQAIMADPNWCRGRYVENGNVPELGLAVARMSAHVNYLTPEKLAKRFGRAFGEVGRPRSFHSPEFAVESYLRHQGVAFVSRFDANSYLYLTKAIDHFDLASKGDGLLPRVFCNNDSRFCIIAFSSDWLQPPAESRRIVRALNAAGADVTFSEVETDNGHDAFLLNEPELFNVVRHFLDATAEMSRLAI
jgi:homoserine O-acetyltransferase